MNKTLISPSSWPWRRISSVLLAIGLGLILGSILQVILPSPEPSNGLPSRQTNPRERTTRTTTAVPLNPANPVPSTTDQPKTRHAISPDSKKLFALTTRFEHLSNNEFLSLAKSPPGGSAMQRSVLHAWAGQDPEGMYDALLSDKSLPSERLREWMKYPISTLTNTNHTRVIYKLDALTGSEQTHALRHHAIGALKDSGDYGRALDLEAKWPGNSWTGTNSEQFAKWALSDPARAISKIQLLPLRGHRISYLSMTGEALAAVDPEHAAKLAKTLPTESQGPFLNTFIGTRAKDDPVEAIAILESIATNPEVLSAAAPTAIKRWMKESPEDAIAWSETHLVGEKRMTVLVDAIAELASNDFQSAADTAYGMQPGPTRNAATAKVFSVLLASGGSNTQDEIEDWITAFPDPQSRCHALASVSSELTRSFPDIAISLAEYEDRTLAPERIIQRATEFIADKDITQATAWVQSLPRRNREIAEKVLARRQAK